MLPELFEALAIVLTPQHLIFILVGMLAGLLLGAIPGIGGLVTLALLLPITLAFEPNTALIFLMAALGGLNFGGSIPAILMNVPGTAPSIITTLDGFPMSKDNRAAEAIGASAAASAAGAIIGFGFLLLILPVVRQVMLLFGPPEFLVISVLGALSIAYVLRGSFLNGVIATLIGVMIGFHGFSGVTGGLRYSFNTVYLYDGIPLVVVVIGLFAIGEMIHLGIGRETIASEATAVHGNPITGVKSTLKNLPTVIKGSAIGIGIGLIPAVGATVSTLISYVNESKNHPDTFGKGNVLGVIAPESSNDAKDASSLVPTLAFAIPGSPSHVVLMGGLILHGLTPGPGIFGDHLVTILAMILALLISNIFTSAIGIGTAQHIIKITQIPLTIIIPVIVVLSLFGAYGFRGNPIDLLILIPIGLFGYFAVQYDLSRVALLFGLVLGPIIEKTFHQTMQIAAGQYMRILTRPVFAAMIVAILLIALYIVSKRSIEYYRDATQDV